MMPPQYPNELTDFLNTLDDVQVLARNIFCEARGEPEEGQLAVAAVVLNRVFIPGKFRDTVKGVVTQPYQFSWTHPNDPNYKKAFEPWKVSQVAWDRALAIAQEAMAGTMENPVDGAAYYFNPHVVRPDWAQNFIEVATIGHHLFMRGPNDPKDIVWEV